MAWAAWMGFQLLVLVLYPTVIAPLFNRFEPLPAGEARERIESLLARCGFASSGLFVMDGSKRSGHGNAYFTGFGRAKRVVFFDTLLARLSGDELEAVLAHELGHFKLKHVMKRIAWSAALSLAFLAAAGVAHAGAVVLRGARHSGGARPDGDRRDPASRCRCSCSRCRCSLSSSRRSPRCTRAATNSRPTRSRRRRPRAPRSSMRW